MYKQIIERITHDVVHKQTKETMFDLVSSRVDSCRLFKRFGTAHLLGIKDNPTKFRIIICSRYCPTERLIAFAHEVLHIFYIVPELPRTFEQYKNISEKAYLFLEDTIEDLSTQTVRAHESFWKEMFEKSFGFSVDTSPVDIK